MPEKSAVEQKVAAVRAFNRFWTKRIGVLGGGLLSTSYSLTEARVLFELAQREWTEVADLRRELDLDPGYVSRILAKFKEDGLVTTAVSEADARRQQARLTRKGRATFATLSSRSSDQVRGMLERLGVEDQARLVQAMKTLQQVLDERPAVRSTVIRPLAPGDLGWVVHRHGVLYAREYAWDETFEALVARIVADYVDRRDPRLDCAWIAEVGGGPAGCVFCVKKTSRVAQLRLLLVEPSARGLGIGSRLVDECIRFAVGAGYRELVLWTNHPLRAARRIYERAGFTLAKEEKHRSFGHELVGQSFTLDLVKHVSRSP